MFEKLKKELYAFYLHGDEERSRNFAKYCFEKMDARLTEGMTVLQEKLLQYDVITEEFEPVLFPSAPYFYETGFLTSLSDGTRMAKGFGFTQANGWVYDRHEYLFVRQDEKLYEKKLAQAEENLYLICGPYNDTYQHYNFNCRPFLEIGAVGIAKKAEAELASATDGEEREFLSGVIYGMERLCRMAERFAEKAEKMLPIATDPEHIKNLSLIAKTARKIPAQAPEGFYEALAMLAFLRTAVGSLEGVGPNTFGRVDKDLIGFYVADVESGKITKDEAYELICRFLLLWDCHYDHDMPMEGYADHELENTYTLGGCDDDGKPLYNELTEMFLRATRENKIIFPKIKSRFSSESPKEYLDAINESIVRGTTTVLLQNDESTIAALERAGRPSVEARDYFIAGCWDIVTNEEKSDHGSYLNLLKPFEFALHNLKDKMKRVGIDFKTYDGCCDFEEFYNITLHNCELLLREKLDVEKKGGQIFHKVDRLPIFSSTLSDCVKKHADYTMGGARYHDDYQLMFGFPNIVDSLLAIKTLVFDSGEFSFDEYLQAVRSNWEGYENVRLAAIGCRGWGDGSAESCELAARFNRDLYEICSRCESPYGGRVNLGHITYTEIRWWGEKTLATPDGRRNGEYFAQGLTPSRLKRIPCVNDVINSMAALDGSLMGANSVVNIILPPAISLDRAEAFLRAVAKTAVQSLQLNCTSREQLLDAQRHPEKYPDLIVRVTGFSAKFTSLSRGWQDEVITRNFYD